MLQLIETINNAVNNFIWGVPAMICIFGVGLYLSLRTRFLQISKIPVCDPHNARKNVPQTRCFRWRNYTVPGGLYSTCRHGRYR